MTSFKSEKRVNKLIPKKDKIVIFYENKTVERWIYKDQKWEMHKQLVLSEERYFVAYKYPYVILAASYGQPKANIEVWNIDSGELVFSCVNDSKPSELFADINDKYVCFDEK